MVGFYRRCARFTGVQRLRRHGRRIDPEMEDAMQSLVTGLSGHGAACSETPDQGGDVQPRVLQ